MDTTYDFLASAEKVHSLAGHDFPTVFDHFFNHGYLFKGPNFFLVGGHDPKREDAWLVWWAEIYPPNPANRRAMMRTLLKLMPYRKPWIGWARPMKGRVDVKYYSTSRLFGFTQISIANHAPAPSPSPAILS